MPSFWSCSLKVPPFAVFRMCECLFVQLPPSFCMHVCYPYYHLCLKKMEENEKHGLWKQGHQKARWISQAHAVTGSHCDFIEQTNPPPPHIARFLTPMLSSLRQNCLHLKGDTIKSKHFETHSFFHRVSASQKSLVRKMIMPTLYKWLQRMDSLAFKTVGWVIYLCFFLLSGPAI